LYGWLPQTSGHEEILQKYITKGEVKTDCRLKCNLSPTSHESEPLAHCRVMLARIPKNIINDALRHKKSPLAEK